MSNARLRLAFARETMSSGNGDMLGKPPGFPGLLPLVRFPDKSLRDFPTPLHAQRPTEVGP
jgi:hypothetical protein